MPIPNRLRPPRNRTGPLAAVAVLAAVASFAGCGASVATEAPVPGSDSRYLIQLQLVSEAPDPDLETRVLDGERLHLEPEVVAADPDLSRPRLESRDGEWTLDIRFTVDGGVRLDTSLLDRSGRRLVLIVDSAVRRIVTVRPQLGASRMLVPLEISDAEAARLQESIRSRWPEEMP